MSRYDYTTIVGSAKSEKTLDRVEHELSIAAENGWVVCNCIPLGKDRFMYTLERRIEDEDD